MVRKLVRTLLSLSLATPVSVWGLGLGDIHLHSALNEKLNAEIELLSVEPGDLQRMEVELASYDAFKRFGLERLGTLALLEFTVDKGPDGRPYVRVTSKQAIREPFLDFLIQVEWRQGKLLREYTLLLDPPELTQRKAPTTAAPVAAAPAKKAAAAKPSPSPRSAASGGSNEYGPVAASDTLWSIAKQMRTDDAVSIKQMMIALFEANPEAFLDNNINKLRKGAVLRLEDPAAARAISRAAADREVARQTEDWSQTKQKLAEQGKSRPQSAAPAQTSKSVASREVAKLKLVAPEGEAETAGGGAGEEGGEAAVESVRKELMLALETAETQRRENEELQKRLQELEGQLESMQRLLSLKSDDMSRFQQQLASGDLDLPPEDAAVSGDDAEAEAGAEGETGTSDADSPSVGALPAADPQPTPLQLAGDTAGPQAEEGVGEPETAVGEAKPAPAEAKEPAPKPRPQPAAEPEPFYVAVLDTVTTNPMVAGGVGFGALLLGLLAITIRRRLNGGGFQESILSGGTSSMLNSKAGGDSSLETSLLSDLADDGMGGMPVQDSEVDPIAEADVYMAYGRHQQAEELLKDAIAQEPERQELHGKLMEIYYKTKNKRAFEAHAAVAVSALQGSGPVWDRIAAMGYELAPENELFAEAPENVAPATEGEADPSLGAIDDVLDIGLDLDALAAEMEPASDEYGDRSGGGFDDLDLNADIAAIEAAIGRADPGADSDSAAHGELAELDLDLGFEEQPEQAPAAAAGADANGPFDALELDANSGTEPAEPDSEVTPAGAEVDGGAADDDPLEGLDFGFQEEAGDDADPAADAGQGADFAAGLDFALEDDIADATDAAEVGEDADVPGGLDFALEDDTDGATDAAEVGEDADALGGLDFALEDDTAGATDTAEVGEDADAAGGLDFALGGDTGDSTPAAGEDDASLDQPDFGPGDAGLESMAPAAEAEAEAQDNGLEFDLDDFQLPEQEETAPVEHEAGSVMDFDLGDFELPEDDQDDARTPASDIPAAGAPSGTGAELAAAPSAAAGDDEDAFGDLDFGDGLDEVGTKLDLATAYVEMGDTEGARDMLEEVLGEGDAEQRQKAQQLLDQIASDA